jgi:hypothetical protein
VPSLLTDTARSPSMAHEAPLSASPNFSLHLQSHLCRHVFVHTATHTFSLKTSFVRTLSDGHDGDDAWRGHRRWLAPPRRVLAPAHAAIAVLLACRTNRVTGLRHRMRRVAVPLAAAHIASFCPSQLHASRRSAPRGCTHRVAVLLAPAYSLCVRFLFSFFLLTSSFLFCSPVAMPQWHDGDVATRT